MSSPEKRAREKKKQQKKREKAMRRRERREMGPSEPEIVSAEEVAGDLRSIEAVMADLQGGGGTSRAAAPIPAKLFVGSLSWDTTTEGLRKAFEAFVEVSDAVVIEDRDTGRSRGFGFVTMADRKDASKAIDAMDGSELDGRTIVVNVATERR